MRLLDRLLASRKIASQENGYRVGLEDAVVVIADQLFSSLRDHLYIENDSILNAYKKLGNLRPPWKNVFVEFEVEGNQCGTHCCAIEKTKHPELFQETANAVPDDAEVLVCFVSYKYNYKFNHFDFWPSGEIEYAISIDKYGQYLSSHSQSSCADVIGFSKNVTITALAVFSFANCKNVTLEDSTEFYEPKPKIKRRLKLPTVKRYTLNIDGHSTAPRRVGDTLQPGIMPYHLCRGHFATYTEEKPLFGKYVGKFWKSPHMKGREERGKIEKDYRIVADLCESQDANRKEGLPAC